MISPSRVRSIIRLPAIAWALLAASSALGGEADEVVEAVWKSQRFALDVRTAHTCSGLRARMRSLLTMLGAHASLGVDCRDAAGARVVRVVLTTPVEATAEHLADLTANPTHVLAARVRGVSPETGPARFPAHWRTISFAAERHLRLTAADCELLTLLRREVMPTLDVRIVKDEVRCPAAFGARARPQLTVVALVERS